MILSKIKWASTLTKLNANRKIMFTMNQKSADAKLKVVRGVGVVFSPKVSLGEERGNLLGFGAVQKRLVGSLQIYKISWKSDHLSGGSLLGGE
jgi:hypothetical protein